MEEVSPAKAELNYILSSNITNLSPTDDLGIKIFDGLRPPGYSGGSLEQKNEPHSNTTLNTKVELLKSFRQQWYKSRDSHRYNHLPFHTNICKKPPKIQRMDNSLHVAMVHPSPPTQEVSQVANVAPADPIVLEKILKDPSGYINVQGKLREVRFYGEKSIVMMDWNDPRDVCFQSSSRSVIIDDKDILILSFNSSYTDYTFPDGSTIKIRLGAPTRDFYINGEPVEVKFGGPPVNVLVGDSYHKIQLGGPSPKVYVGNVKRSDIMAGRINLIIDEDLNNIFHIYLDSKPQKIDINGTPFILRFANSLQMVYVNERPLNIDFGGAAVAVKLYNEIHSLRFSALPPGIVPGLVHIVGMENKQTDIAVRNLFPSILPWNDPKLTTLPAIANYNYYLFNYYNHRGMAGNSEDSITQNTNLNLPFDKTSVEENQKSTSLDVMNLYQKLVENGIIQPQPCETQAKGSKSINVDFSKPETLKLRNMRIVYELYTGAQCEICSLRYTRKSGEYASHLDWHYQIKRHTKDQQSNWWCHLTEFPRGEQDVGRLSWFEQQKRRDPLSIYENLTVPAKDYGLMPKCSLCYEEFNQFYDEVTEEWLLRNAVVHNLKLCHPKCCMKDNERNITWLRREMNIKMEQMISSRNGSNKNSHDHSQSNTTLEKETLSFLKQHGTVPSDDLNNYRASTDAESDKLSNNGAFSTDYQNNDIDEVEFVQSEIEIVDLSKEDIQLSIENKSVEEMASFTSCEENEENQNGLAETSLITDYTTIKEDYKVLPSLDIPKNNHDVTNLHSQSSYENDSEGKEIKFYEISLSPETVKPLIRDTMMTVQPDIVKGEINSSTCTIM